LRSLNKQGREGDREFFLESWNGTGSYSVDRIGRGTLHVEALCLSILGGIQPSKLAKYVADATEAGWGDDGLLQRFQILIYPEGNKNWQLIDRWPNTEAREQAYLIYKKIAGLLPEEVGATQGEYEEIPALRFSEEAQSLFNAWLSRLEHRLHSEEVESPAFESHLAKYRSLMPSLALIFHLVEWAIGESTGGPVTVGAAQKAAAWCDFLEQHALKVYAGAINPEIEAAHALAKKIEKGNVEDGSEVRSIYRKQWSLLRNHSAVMDALQVLEDCHWVRVEIVATSGSGRHRITVQLHPSLKGGRN